MFNFISALSHIDGRFKEKNSRSRKSGILYVTGINLNLCMFI